MIKPKTFIFVYKVTNKRNGKYYIGVHTTQDLNDGYMGEGISDHNPTPKHLQWEYNRDYKKYGKKGFEKTILKFFDDEEEAYKYERKLLDKSRIDSDKCYNNKQGGTSGTWSKELSNHHKRIGTFKKSQKTKDKLSRALKGKRSNSKEG